MYIALSKRQNLSKTKIFTKIIKKNPDTLSWERQTILLIHGGPGGNHTLFADIENELFKIADLILIDLRGCGLSSEASTQDCTLENHIDDIYFILKKLNLSNPIVLGCSYGAIVALGFSIKYKNNLSKLILISCAVSGEFIENAKKNLNILGNKEQVKAAQKLWNGTFESPEEFSQYYNIMAPLYIYNYNKIKTIPASLKTIPYNTDLVNFAFTTFLPVFNFKEKLSEISVETLIFSGKNDWITDMGEAKILHAGIKNSSLIILDDCGHFPWKDKWDDFFINIKNFIK